jgi:hypothetical protein
MDMANIISGYGAALILLGLGSYLITGADSLTALLPAFFGMALALLGREARRGAAEGWVLPAAALVAAVGLLGVLPNLLAATTLLGGGEIARPFATAAQGVMALLCGALLARLAVAWRRQGTGEDATVGA